MSMTRRFQDLVEVTDSDIQMALQRSDPGELALVSITVALLSDDPAGAQDLCLLLGANDDPRVRAHAIMCLGHLARRFRKLDQQRVRPLIETSLREDDAYVRDLAHSAADEIHQFLGWDFSGHVYGERKEQRAL